MFNTDYDKSLFKHLFKKSNYSTWKVPNPTSGILFPSDNSTVGIDIPMILCNEQSNKTNDSILE